MANPGRRRQGLNSLVYDREGRAVARVVSGPDQRQTLVATVNALDRAVADLRRKDGEPAADPSRKRSASRGSARPIVPKPRTTEISQRHRLSGIVSGLRYALAIWSGACIRRLRRVNGKPARRQGGQGHMFDAPDALDGWVDPRMTLPSRCKRRRKRPSPPAAWASGMRKPRRATRD